MLVTTWRLEFTPISVFFCVVFHQHQELSPKFVCRRHFWCSTKCLNFRKVPIISELGLSKTNIKTCGVLHEISNDWVFQEDCNKWGCYTKVTFCSDWISKWMFVFVLLSSCAFSYLIMIRLLKLWREVRIMNQLFDLLIYLLNQFYNFCKCFKRIFIV